MPPKPKFQEGDRVLCFHGPLLYEAKPIKFEILKDKTIRYFIHYNGWNKSWDEWVPETRVLKYNEASLQKQRELKVAHEQSRGKSRGRKSKDNQVLPEDQRIPTKEKKEKKKKDGPQEEEAEQEDEEKEEEKVEEEEEPAPPPPKRTATPKPDKPDKPEKVKKRLGRPPSSATSTPATPKEPVKEVKKEKEEPPRKKRGTRAAEMAVETEETYSTKIAVRIKLSEDLKSWLVNDWNLVTVQKQLVKLPCSKTIEDLMKEYLQDRPQNNPNRESYVEMVAGLKDYFNVMLGSQLLYKFERAQYAEVLADYPDRKMTEVYGVTHLLRLFVKLGSMLAYTPLDEKSMQTLINHIHDFIKWISKNSSSLLSVDDYIVASPEYHRKAM